MGSSSVGATLPKNKRAKAPVDAVRIVAHHDVDGFMIHDPGHAFVGRQSFVGVAERRDADADEVGRHGSGGAMAVVAKILNAGR